MPGGGCGPWVSLDSLPAGMRACAPTQVVAWPLAFQYWSYVPGQGQGQGFFLKPIV